MWVSRRKTLWERFLCWLWHAKLRDQEGVCDLCDRWKEWH